MTDSIDRTTDVDTPSRRHTRSDAGRCRAATGAGVTPGRRSRPRRRAGRRPARCAVAAIVVAVAGLADASRSSDVAGDVDRPRLRPADSVAYGELRLDLPGDQRQEVGEFLSKFPGFADQAALDTKLDEVLDRLVAEGTDGKQTYTQDIKPWFDGELALRGRCRSRLGRRRCHGARTPCAAAPVDQGRRARELLVRPRHCRPRASPVRRDVQRRRADRVHRAQDAGRSRLRSRSSVARSPLVGDLASVKAAVDTKGASALAKGDAVAQAPRRR